MMLYLSSISSIFLNILPFSVFLMAFAEIIAGTDSLLKRSICWWEQETQQMLYRAKLGCVAIGSGIGYLCGSYLYQETGISGGCMFIGIFGILHLVLTHFYARRLLETQTRESGEATDVVTDDNQEASKVKLYKYFIPFLLSSGAIMVTTAFTVTPLYWEDVWKAKPVICGLLLCIGEIIGFFVLILSKFKYLRSRKLIQQPALIVVAAILGMMAMAPMAFAHSYYADAAATVLVEVANGLLHSSGVELMVIFLPTHLFQDALTRGYVWKRFVNSGFGMIFALLYGVYPHSP